MGPGCASGYVMLNALSSGLASDRLVVGVQDNQSTSFLDVLAEKVQGGHRTKRFDKGKWTGGIPLGYRIGYTAVYSRAKGTTEPVETGVLEPDNEPQPRIGFEETYTRADLVRLIGDLYASGRYGHRPLAAHLNVLGYRNAQGAPFVGSAIRVIVSNPAYTGVRTWHMRPDKKRRVDGTLSRDTYAATEVVQGAHEPLWSEVLWSQIQAVRKRQFRGSNGGQLHNLYPFRRLAVCDRCGRPMFGEAHRNGNSGVLYYACPSQRERHDCAQRGVRSAHLEDQVGEWLATLVIPEDWRADIERMQRGVARAAEHRPPVDLTRIGRQLDNLKELFVLGDVTREEYVGRSRALKASLEDGRPQPTYSEAVLVKAARLLADLGDLWTKATPDERREIAQNLFREVRVRDDRIVAATLAHDDYLLLVASAASRDQVGGARPEGFEPPTL